MTQSVLVEVHMLLYQNYLRLFDMELQPFFCFFWVSATEIMKIRMFNVRYSALIGCISWLSMNAATIAGYIWLETACMAVIFYFSKTFLILFLIQFYWVILLLILILL